MRGFRKTLTTALASALLLGSFAQAAYAAPGDRYGYDQPGDKNFVSNTNVLERYNPTDNTNNKSYKVTATRAQANAQFTTADIQVDGVKEAVWDTVPGYPIGNKFNNTMTAAAPGATAEGTMRLLWDGPVLYVLVEVTGDTTESDTGTPNWNAAKYTPAMDGLFVFMDVFNDKWGMETDTQGVFFQGANPDLTTGYAYSGNPATGIPSLGSFFNSNYQDYSTRLKAVKSSGYNAATNAEGVNYTYEMALQIEGWGDAWDRELANGTQVGLEVGIYNQNESLTYWSKTDYNAGREGSSNMPDSERVRNRDWGEVTLAGWDGTSPVAYSGWRADEDIRFWNSKNNPGGSGNGTAVGNDGDGSNVWTPASKNRMVAAKAAYNAIKDDPSATRAEKEAAVQEVCEAFAGLRWADTKYPDPHDLPTEHTLPNIWEFFDPTKGTNGMVTNADEWTDRKQEILDMAQFYEYGYKPKLGVDYTVALTGNSYAGTGNATVTAKVTPTNANFSGGIAQDVTISITMPTDGVPEGQAAPISFAGSWTANGIANIAFPNWAADGVRNDNAWGTRNGTFYKLFPYARNSATGDVSIEMANATAVSAYLDILELAVADNEALAAKIDPSRAVTKGFSINGKLAFVAGVFDERVKAIIAGGAGATGPANWRYNAQGQEYNFKDTIFSNNNPGAESIVAHGTEGPGNSYRHNRTRETEMFRHFLPYGHMYNHEEGSYAYGEFGRLPFDQTSLVATLAPNRAIIIDTNLNDYNDGAATDNMSLSVAKSAYRALGANGDDFVKFNTGNYVSSGDPHGAANAAVEGKYLHDLFYGTATLTEDEAARLNTDPYSLNVANGQTQSPYDYYWGGYNTITGGQNGINGTDGWYYHTLAGVVVPGTMDVSLSAANANAGGSAQVKLTFSGVQNLGGANLVLSYDSTKLTFESIQFASGFSQHEYNAETPGRLSIAMLSSDGITADTLEAATIAFTIDASAAAGTQIPVTLTTAEACDSSADKTDIPVRATNGVITVATSNPPVVSGVSFTGEAVVGKELAAAYTYTGDAAEQGTTFRWLISSDGTTYAPIDGATDDTLTVKPEYAGKYVRVEVTGRSDGGELSAPVAGDNGRNKVIVLGDAMKDGDVVYKDALHVLQFTVDKVTLDPQQLVAADMNGDGSVNVIDVVALLRLVVAN